MLDDVSLRQTSSNHQRQKDGKVICVKKNKDDGWFQRKSDSLVHNEKENWWMYCNCLLLCCHRHFSLFLQSWSCCYYATEKSGFCVFETVAITTVVLHH